MATLRSDVIPSSSLSYVRDGGVIDVQHSCHVTDLERSLPNPLNFDFREPRLSVAFAKGVSLALDTFPHVQGVSAEVEMRRLNTDGSVAGMQDEQSVLDGAVIDAVRRLVCPDSLTVHSEHAVATTISCGSPVPAPFSGGRCQGRRSRHVPRKGFGLTASWGTLLSASPQEGHHVFAT